ncbi:hypothetical protein CBR_g4368 [Chara braunii]|uniref:Uncharacterized protein n=1 Tax=Chara braunii TaxID=69332 RepID=A0A388KHT1_CHABU|nr:hypothetical protein CBR_g4368 [Chara braunii]|eukprot:GBG69533.1 hypothetical protein CBR_g4368 [Chara braunii]
MQILDKCNDFVSKAQQKEREELEAKERERRKREKDEEAEQRRKEREELEDKMGKRLESKLAPIYDVIMGKGLDKASSSSVNDEVCRLRRENEELRSKHGAKEQLPPTDLVERLQRENHDLKRLEADLKQKMEGDLAALHWEIRGLKECRENLGRSELAKQIDDLRAEMEVLRKRNEETEEVAQLWRNEALRPGNKRGSINVSTPASEGQDLTRSRLGISDEAGRLRAELSEIKERRRCDQTKVDMLKERGAEAEAKRMQAEAELARLQKKMSDLTTGMAVCSMPSGLGTNLKERMEEAAKIGFRTGRKGLKMTCGRLPRPEGSMRKANDKFVFLQEERKRLRALKKGGVEPLCREAGIPYQNMEVSVEELAQLNMKKAFGNDDVAEKETGTAGRGNGVLEDSDEVSVEEVSSYST